MTAEAVPWESGSDLVTVRGLKVHYPVKLPFLQRMLLRDKAVVHAVDGVDFALRPGEIFGLVGESGCGKTTVGRTILRLVEPTEGTVVFEGRDITHLKERRLEAFRRRAQIVFQDPHAALNPAMSIGRAIGHPLEIHGVTSAGAADTAAPVQATDHDVAEEQRQAVLEIMREVGLTPEEQLYEKYPADLSGGQKQRAVIARAMILRPKLIVADEPVAMLDMSIRARVLELMIDLKNRHRLTYLFITHDLATAKFVCDRIAIMYLGRIVEMGPAKEIYQHPKHPYTRALLAAIPVPDPTKRAAKDLPKGEVPDAVYPPAGCRFHPRCAVALSTCGWEGRDVITYLEERWLDLVRARAEASVGPVESWSAKGLEARRAGREESPDRLVARVREVLAGAPRPLLDAIQDLRAEGGDVVVRFRPPAPLAPKDVDGRIVECLLY
ncbi:MAG TPA: ABC transporter ATP-binding protein [Thermoplasmata archaeon]|nr:ABC transporter ATP-binding protein [Thermoplasmata archaeon]